jgi:predicted ATP-grasp superfamily ATP-dependent carboligase
VTVIFNQETASLVFKLGRYRLHHNGLAVVRSLGRAGVKVYIVNGDRRTPAALSRYVSGEFVWSSANESIVPDHLVQDLNRIAALIDRSCIVIPTNDLAAIFLENYGSRLPAQFILPKSTSELAQRLTNKQLCSEIIQSAGLLTPEQIVVHCPAPDQIVDNISLPAVIKCVNQSLSSVGTRAFSTTIAHNRERLIQILQNHLVESYDVIVQEFFPGDDWLYHGYYNAQSEALVSFTGRKLRSRPAYVGETAYARAETNHELRKSMEQFLKRIGYHGIVSMDIRYDKRCNQFRLLDVNPRVGACFRLFVNTHGIDVVRALHLDLTGRDVPQGDQHDGRTYLAEGYDFSVQRTYKLGSAMHWLGDVFHANELAWFHRDDLLPPLAAIALYLWYEVTMLFSKIVHR